MTRRNELRGPKYGALADQGGNERFGRLNVLVRTKILLAATGTSLHSVWYSRASGQRVLNEKAKVR